MSLATLDGNTCTSARVQIPAWGVWHADATLDDEVTLTGAVVLEMADLTLRGTVVSGGPYKGASRYRIAGGAAGWGKQAPARGYTNDAGVRLATVLTDAALVAGETLDATTVAATTVGPAWTREAGPAARALELLAREAWYVGEDGITRLGRRARVVYVGDAERMAQDLARGTIELAAEEIATLVPGAVVDGVEAVDVLHEVGERGLRTMIWGSGVGATSRRLAATRRLFAQLFPDLRFRGVSEYRVVTQTGARLNLQAIKVSLGMPDLTNVRVRPGVAGCKATVALGSSVLVAFVDSDPGRPVVVGFEDADGAGYAPTRLDLVGTSDVAVAVNALAGRVVRYGDTITFGVAGVDGPIVAAAPVTASRVRA